MPRFTPPSDWLRIETCDAHAAGEPLRVVVSGWPAMPGDTILARRRWAREHLEPLRRAVILEPRGHADMYAAVLTDPVTADGDAGILFLHNEGYSTMCGHGVIAAVTVGLEAGLLAPRERGIVRLDTPAGRVTARAEVADGRVVRVAFENVPSFVLAPEATVAVDGLGDVPFDLAYGGAFYAYVDAAAVGLTVAPEHFAAIVDVGRRIKRAVEGAHPVVHPEGDDDLNFLYGVIFSQPGVDGARLRNVCVFADGEVDRSPTGTGVSGRAAILAARGELAAGEEVVIESLIGTRFAVRVARTTTVGERPAIVPEVSGRAWWTGRSELFVDPTDPLREGVLLR
jgi:trans-L-3-hydroxyproline dehydratase